MYLNLSMLIIMIVIINIFPAILLSSNKIKIYIYSCIPGFILVFFAFFICLNFPDVKYTLGKATYPLFHWLLDNYEGFTFNELYHISANLFLAFIYVIFYIITFIIIKLCFVGVNPNASRPATVFNKVILSTSFMVFTAVVISIILIEIRMILPINDGFLSSIFQLIYKIEA